MTLPRFPPGPKRQLFGGNFIAFRRDPLNYLHGG